jgi:hypothetical protein
MHYNPFAYIHSEKDISIHPFILSDYALAVLHMQQNLGNADFVIRFPEAFGADRSIGLFHLGHSFV